MLHAVTNLDRATSKFVLTFCVASCFVIHFILFIDIEAWDIVPVTEQKKIVYLIFVSGESVLSTRIPVKTLFLNRENFHYSFWLLLLMQSHFSASCCSGTQSLLDEGLTAEPM